MERLTKRISNGKIGYALLAPGECVDVIDLLHVWGDRLADYEDTMPLEQAQELAQAEKDGRLVVLPCKLHESIFYLEDGELYDDVPYEVSLGQKSGEWNDSLMFECQYGFGFFEEDVGKTVFLTSEEAEAALKKREEADNEVVR